MVPNKSSRARSSFRSIETTIRAAGSALVSKFRKKSRLFEGDSEAFVKFARKCTLYGEYGCGKSTIWVDKNTDVRILSVDTSKEWLDIVRERLTDPSRVTLVHVDLGPLGKWGRPVSNAEHERFHEYPEALWSFDVRPDLVLVDGRFRVSCFLYSLLHAREGAVIVFDDYVDRPAYHIVETIVRPIETCGRQAIFMVPADFDRARARDMFERFVVVMD